MPSNRGASVGGVGGVLASDGATGIKVIPPTTVDGYVLTGHPNEDPTWEPGGGSGGSPTFGPSDTVEDLDGTNDPGVSDEFSRGDHKHDDMNRPTDDEKAALVGTFGFPSTYNPYVTDTDPRLDGTIPDGDGGATGTKIGGTPLVPRPSWRRIQWTQSTGGTNTLDSNGGALAPVNVGLATSANLVDDEGVWDHITLTTTVSSGKTYAGVAAQAGRLDHDPFNEWFIRFHNTDHIRLWIMISDGVPTSTDDLSARKGVGVRFSKQVAGDNGFVEWSSDGSTQTIGSQIGGNIAVDTAYVVQIGVNPDNSNCYLTVYEGLANCWARTNGTTHTITTPSAAFGVNMRVSLGIWNTAGAAANTFDFAREYFESF